MIKINLFFVALMATNASFGAARPISGWSDGRSGRGLGSPNTRIFPRVQGKVTSIAMSNQHSPWVTTADGRVLRLRKPSDSGWSLGPPPPMTDWGSWEDVTNKFSSSCINKGDPGRTLKFKYVTSQPYGGDIWAITEEGQVYQWDNAGRSSDDDN